MDLSEDPLSIALALLVVFALYVIAKVIGFNRKSEEQWRSVDKTRLKKWEDDDDD